MSASSNVVALLADQNSEAGKSEKCLAGQENKIDKSVKSLNCVVGEAGLRKKRLDNIGCILETLDKGHGLRSEFNKDGVIGATSLLTGENFGAKTFGIEQKRIGLPAIEPGLGKIGRRQGKRDRKVGLELAPHRKVMGNMVQAKINVLGGPDKYGVAADCHLTVNCTLAVFRTLVVPHAARVLPKNFNKDTAVILAQAVNSSQITSIFGPAKVRVLRGSYSWVAIKMDLVFLPSSGELRMWWVMST